MRKFVFIFCSVLVASTLIWATVDTMDGSAITTATSIEGNLAGKIEGQTIKSGATGWTDPNAANLAIRMWFDPTFTNAAGTVNDSSGNTNHGTLYPTAATGPAWTIIGTNAVAGSPNIDRGEHGFTFDGSDDYIRTFTEVGFSGSSNAFTWAGWVKRHNDNRTEFIADKGDAGNTVRDWTIYFSAAGTLNAQVYEDGDTAIYLRRYGPDFNIADGWIHVAVTYTNSTQTHADIKIYTNAVQMDTTDGSVGVFTAPEQSSSAFVKVGATGIGVLPFDGIMDDHRVYAGIALTPSELTNLVTNTQKPNSSDENGY